MQTYVAPTDKVIDRAVLDILKVHRFDRDIRVARRILKKSRSMYAIISSGSEEEATVPVLAAIQAAGIVQHVDDGSPVNQAELSDDDLMVVVNSAIQCGIPPEFGERLMRISTVAAFLLDPARLAAVAVASLAEGDQA